MISHHMAENAVEPGQCTFLVVQRVGTLDRSSEALLKDIFHDGFVTDSTPNKLPERRLVLKKALNDYARLCLRHNSSTTISSYPPQECSV